MAHRIFTGSFAALEKCWLEQVGSLQQNDPLAPVAVLVGSNLLASYLRGRIAEQGHAVANLRFYTFLDLAARLAETAGASKRKPRLPRLGASAILESLLVESAPPVFARVADYAGFRDALLDTFRDLRDAGIDARELEKGIRICSEHNEDRREHLAGLAELYRRFRGKAELFHGVDDDFRAAAGNADLAAASLGTSVLLIYGIYDATFQQTVLLGRLKDAMELRYFLPYLDESVSAFARPFLDARTRELGAAAEPLSSPAVEHSLGMLHRLDFGFQIPPRDSSASGRQSMKVDADGSFALVSAPGESRAATETIREILRAVRDGVIGGFHEVAVILRQPEEQAPILIEALRLRDLPFFLDGGRSLLTRPLGRAVVAITELESASFSRQAILITMELMAAALPEAAALNWAVQDWRALTNDPRFLSGVDAWNEATKALVREAARASERAQARAAGDFDETEGRFLSVPAARKRLSCAQGLLPAWEALHRAAAGWPDRLSWKEWSELLQARLEPLLSASQDWKKFSTVLDELAQLSDAAALARIDPRVSRPRLASALSESLSSLSVPEGRFMKTGVNLLTPAAARGLRFPLVIVPGLDEGRFPARLRQDPLLLDAERSRIGSSQLPLKSQRGDEEKLLFDMASRSAGGRLVLMTSRLDESSDRERIPSEFFLRVCAAARGRAAGLRDLAEGDVPGLRSVSLDNPAPGPDQIAVDEGEIRLRLLTSHPAWSRAVLKELQSEEPLLLKGPAAYDEARWLPSLTAFDGRLSDPSLVRAVAERLGPAAGQVSPSRLEDYAKCPYLFYLKRVMGLEGWTEEEAPEQMDALDRGQVVHAILEKFMGDFSGERLASASLETLGQSLALQARDALDAARPAGMPDLLWEIESENLERMLQGWLEFEKERIGVGLYPAQFERAFGTFSAGESSPGLRLEAGRHVFTFRGRIDRIDLSRDRLRARVTDYKTGRLPKSMIREKRPLLMGGEKIQIAVYRGALSVLEGFRQVESVEGEYLHLQPRDRETHSCSFSDSSLEEAFGRLPGILEIVGDGIETGVFFARTRGAVMPDGHCRFCDFLPVCGKDRIQREERKAGDPAVTRFLKILALDAIAEEPE